MFFKNDQEFKFYRDLGAWSLDPGRGIEVLVGVEGPKGGTRTGDGALRRELCT